MRSKEFSPQELIHWLNIIDARYPGAKLVRDRSAWLPRGRSATGNLCVFDAEGQYVALLELAGPPGLTDFDEPYE